MKLNGNESVGKTFGDHFGGKSNVPYEVLEEKVKALEPEID